MKNSSCRKITTLSLFILFIITFLILKFRNTYIQDKIRKKEILIENFKPQSTIIEENINKQEKIETKNEEEKNDLLGTIIIPSLDVKAPVYEGVEQNVLKYAVRAL